MTETFRLYRYRWAVLAVFRFVNLTIQVLWISNAPITGPAAQFYGVSDLQIGCSPCRSWPCSSRQAAPAQIEVR